MMRKLVSVSATFVALAILALSVAVGNTPTPASTPTAARAERLEQASTTSRRLQALDDAIADGRFGTRQAVTADPAPGWAGEALVSGVRDDWEPAVAADPRDPYVYILTTRFGYPKPCSGNCPVPHISLHVSADGGRTWGAPAPLCACKGSWQYDPIIEVAPDTGHVYAVYLNGFNVVFVKSEDHGKTWTEPVQTYGNVSWNDKPALATSADGRDIYVSWNGPHGRRPVDRAVTRLRRDVDPDQARRQRPVLLRLRRRRARRRHRDRDELQLQLHGTGRGGRGRRAPAPVHLEGSRPDMAEPRDGHGAAGPTVHHRRAATPTSTPATAGSGPTTTATSSTSTTARSRPAGRNGRGCARRPTAVAPGPVARRCRRQGATRPVRSSRPPATATSGAGTRSRTTRVDGTSSPGARPMAAADGRRRC